MQVEEELDIGDKKKGMERTKKKKVPGRNHEENARETRKGSRVLRVWTLMLCLLAGLRIKSCPCTDLLFQYIRTSGEDRARQGRTVVCQAARHLACLEQEEARQVLPPRFTPS